MTNQIKIKAIVFLHILTIASCTPTGSKTKDGLPVDCKAKSAEAVKTTEGKPCQSLFNLFFSENSIDFNGKVTMSYENIDSLSLLSVKANIKPATISIFVQNKMKLLPRKPFYSDFLCEDLKIKSELNPKISDKIDRQIALNNSYNKFCVEVQEDDFFSIEITPTRKFCIPIKKNYRIITVDFYGQNILINYRNTPMECE